MIDNLAAGSGTGGADEADTKTAMWSPAAIGWVEGYDIRIETQRDASIRGYEIVATSFYAVGEIEDVFGVEMLLDNAD